MEDISPEGNQAVIIQGADVNEELPIFKVLNDHLCALVLDYVSIRELARSERVCHRWRWVVLGYLQQRHNMCFCDYFSKEPAIVENYTNTYRIDRQVTLRDAALQLARKTLQKFSSSVVKVITERNDEEYLEIIASDCPYLRQIEILVAPECNFQLELIKKMNQLEQVSLNYRYANMFKRNPDRDPDRSLGKLLKNHNFEKLEVIYCDDLTGSFLKYIKSNNLKSLNLTNCIYLRILNLLPARVQLRKLPSLTLDWMNPDIYKTLHLLLQETWLLEELSLRVHGSWSIQLNEELIAAFSGLANLRRLDMSHNYFASDALLIALAQNCTHLEHLDLRGCNIHRFDGEYERRYGGCRLTARGVQALCRRSSLAVTTLHFGFIENAENDEILAARIFTSFKSLEFESQCCVELTQEGLQEACHDARERKVPLALRSGCTSPPEGARQQLTIFLCDKLEHYKEQQF